MNKKIKGKNKITCTEVIFEIDCSIGSFGNVCENL
jgi:hypothetical protein